MGHRLIYRRRQLTATLGQGRNLIKGRHAFKRAGDFFDQLLQL